MSPEEQEIARARAEAEEIKKMAQLPTTPVRQSRPTPPPPPKKKGGFFMTQ
jgi:hypothetical protein